MSATASIVAGRVAFQPVVHEQEGRLLRGGPPGDPPIPSRAPSFGSRIGGRARSLHRLLVGTALAQRARTTAKSAVNASGSCA